MKNSAFSLIELIVVVVIIGVLVSFTIPSYSKYFERTRSKYAENNLMMIYNKEKRFKLDNSYYFPCTGSNCPACDASLASCYRCAAANCTLDEINNKLGLDITSSYFNYTLSRSGSGYSVVATRKSDSTLCASSTTTLNDPSSTITKNCSYWQ